MAKRTPAQQSAPIDQDTSPVDSSLAVPDAAITSWLKDLAENTRQWGQYAQQKLLEGDHAEASKALATVNAQIEELHRHAELSQSVMSDLVESVKIVTQQRNELVVEIETLKDERLVELDRAFEDGQIIGEEHLFDQIAEDPSIVSDAVDDAREHNLKYLIAQLRRVGNEAAAQVLEARFEEVRNNQLELARVEEDARSWYFRLPVEARIGAPLLEGEDEESQDEYGDNDPSDEEA